MSEIKGRIIDHFYGGIQRDEKSRIDGAALNIEEIDIYENANYVQAAQIMSYVAATSSSPSSSASASPSGSSPSASVSSSASASVSNSASSSPSPTSSSYESDVQLVGMTSGTETIGDAITLDLQDLSDGTDTEVSAGDLVLLMFANSVGSDEDMEPTTSGYTKIEDLYVDDSYDTNLYVGYKFMGDTPDSNVVIPADGSANSAIVQVWRNVSETDPLSAVVNDYTGGNSILQPLTVTPDEGGSVGVYIGAMGTDDDGGRYISSKDSTMSDFLAATSNSGSHKTSLAVQTKYNTPTPTDELPVFGYTYDSNSTDSWIAVAFCLNAKVASTSVSSSPSASPSGSQVSQVEINAYTGDSTDITWGYAVGDSDEALIYRLYDGGSDTPGDFELILASSDTTNLAFAQSPLMYHKTTESNSIYYLKKFAGDGSNSPSSSSSSSPSASESSSPSVSVSPSSSASASESSSPSSSASPSSSSSPAPTGDTSLVYLVRYNIDDDQEEVWNGSAWATGDPDENTKLTGLDGINDRYFMRVEFGELVIGNGNKIAKVANDGEFVEDAFTLPTSWKSVDIAFIADVGLIIARNINRNHNYCKAFWWDLTSTEQFDDAMTISHGGPQWITNHNETIIAFCAQNGVGRFYAAQASPGAKLIEIPGLQLNNIAKETSSQPISSQKMMSVKDNILFFGLNKTDKTGVYSIGQLDEGKPMALTLAKRFSTTDYANHEPVALHTQGPNFYGSYTDNDEFKHVRCETNNAPDRSSNAIYESVILDEGDPTKDKDMLAVYVNTKPLQGGTAVRAYLSVDYGDYIQLYEENGTSFNTEDALLGNFRAKSHSGKTHQISFRLTSNGTISPKVTGIAYLVRIGDRPAYK